MRPRLVDWGLALGVGLAFASGLWTLTTGRSERWWVFALHGTAGFFVAALLIPKLRRVARRLPAAPAAPSAWAGLGALGLSLVAIGSGVGWAAGVRFVALGYNLLNWHIVFGLLLTAVVSLHMALRARPLRAADLRSRRAALAGAATLLGAALAWPLQQAMLRGLGLPGAARRFTGSRELASFSPAFPSVIWMLDRPPVIDPHSWQLDLGGMVARPLRFGLADLGGAELAATLDCTGGFYTTQLWRGASVGNLLDQAGASPAAGWVRFVSATGYRWSLPIEQARAALVATHVAGAPLSLGHGAPARLVAPGERGFVWVKWLVAIEVRAEPDPGQLVAINVSGLLPPA